MASSDIKKFHFYPEYIWSADDFDNLQDWIYKSFQGAFEGDLGGAVLKGLRVLPGGGLNVTIDPGIAVSQTGKLMVLDTQQVASITAASGNPTKNLIVMRPVQTDMDLIPEPLNPGNNVPLHQKQTFQIVVLNGTPAANPSYPATSADDTVLMGVKLIVGQTVIARSDLDLSVVGRPRKKPMHIKAAASGVTLDPSIDDVIEYDASSASGIVQLPPAGDVEGLRASVIKVDSSSNQVAVSGNGAELISGQNVITLDSQWDRINFYSNGQAWRIL